MGVRAAAIQFGNLVGAAAGGAALAAGGYHLWSLMAGALFALATTPHLRRLRVTAHRRVVTVRAAT